jgi:predicted secreted Zn-dependent protease
MEEERVRIFASGYARDLFRKLKATTPDNIVDLVDIAAKITVSLKDVMEKDDFDRIENTKSKDEVLLILFECIVQAKNDSVASKNN